MLLFKICFFFFCNSILLFSFGQSLNDSLLIYYPFNGNANDSSGNQFHGIAYATLTSDRFGNPNSAYHFNGFDEYIDLPNQSELKPPLPVSFSFWFELDDLSAENTTIFTTDFAQNNHSGAWMCLSSTGYMAINYGDASGNTSPSNRRTKVGTTKLDTAIWYHVVGIVRGPTDMKIYIDCENDEGYYNGSGGDLSYTNNQGSIGRKDGNMYLPPFYFKGKIDDFRYWNKVLSFQEINALCNGTVNIEDYQNNEHDITIYPNPSDNYINLKNAPNNIIRIEIYNTIGCLIKVSSKREKIDITDLNSGIYFLRMVNNNKEIIEYLKFIKK
ncbi:MAG: T9SS type A sorting domain-containing protein [Bacteroidales bacterium]|jgi:hypothetical protein|nr:T9SS type A sorting domain-containing protein [Bacteroidales bacterium]